MSATASEATSAAARQRRNAWIKTMHQWHWISAAISLAGMLLFAVTGITLNHASQIEAQPHRITIEAQLPPELLTSVQQQTDAKALAMPEPALRWIEAKFELNLNGRSAERSEEEIYYALPQPGGDAWLSLDLTSGALSYEHTDRGWISYLNDLHKGRQTGAAWSGFIDVIAIACVVFSITGIVLLQVHAKRRPSTWPLVIAGLLVPFIFAVLFIH